MLLGTRYTMENDFFTAHLAEYFNLLPVVPDARDRSKLHDIIFSELVKGVVLPKSKAACIDIVAKSSHTDCVIFGCTEIGMLLKPADLDLPVFDTLRLHVDAALDFALQETP